MNDLDRSEAIESIKKAKRGVEKEYILLASRLLGVISIDEMSALSSAFSFIDGVLHKMSLKMQIQLKPSAPVLPKEKRTKETDLRDILIWLGQNPTHHTIKDIWEGLDCEIPYGTMSQRLKLLCQNGKISESTRPGYKRQKVYIINST